MTFLVSRPWHARSRGVPSKKAHTTHTNHFASLSKSWESVRLHAHARDSSAIVRTITTECSVISRFRVYLCPQRSCKAPCLCTRGRGMHCWRGKAREEFLAEVFCVTGSKARASHSLGAAILIHGGFDLGTRNHGNLSKFRSFLPPCRWHSSQTHGGEWKWPRIRR